MWQAKRALEQLGCDVTLFSQPFRAAQTRGIPDMYVRHALWRVRLWVEWKAGRNNTTAHQAAWLEREREAGGHAIVARSLEDVLRALREMGAPIAIHPMRSAETSHDGLIQLREDLERRAVAAT